MSDELAPCPFCGFAEIVLSSSYKARWKPMIDFGYCANCGATGPTQERRQDAIAAWNRRPREAELLAACEFALQAITDGLPTARIATTVDKLMTAIERARGEQPAPHRPECHQ